jgi:DNA-binding SARP family transcriptional activator
MEFRILGPMEVTDGERLLELGGLKQRLLLAVLLLRRNEVVSPDELRAELWGERPPATAAKSIQVYVSRLRKELGPDKLVTRAPGYLLRVEDSELDAARFDRLLAEARTADLARAADLLRTALALWRGPALADLAYETSVQADIQRLAELRLTALEERIDADLAAGRHGQLIGELDALVVKHPLRERLRGQLMLALYRSSRHAEALNVYRSAQRELSEELGLEPSRELRRLEQAILRQDSTLDAPPDAAERPPERPRDTGRAPPDRAILVVPNAPPETDALLALAGPLAAAEPRRELIVACVVAPDAISVATTTLALRVRALRDRGHTARAAAFSSPAAGADIVRLTTEHGVDLLLMQAGKAPLDGEARVVLEQAPCDVALLLATSGPPRPGPVLVPFGGMRHDWAALEFGAWVARATDTPLRLIGAIGDARTNGRDASRLLADASLLVQQLAGVAAEPLLATPGRKGLLELAGTAGLLVVGLSDRWREQGLGRTRARLAASAPAPMVLVRRANAADERPGTRFGWSLTAR